MANIKIDFNITSTPYTLKVEDLSSWGPIKGKPTIVEITSPGFTEYKTHWFKQEASNFFNTTNLEMNCKDCDDNKTMIDGVYKITVKGSPDINYKTDYYLKTDLFQMKMNKLLVSNINNKTYSKLFKKKFQQIKFLLWSAEAHLEIDVINKATSLFETAVSELEDLKNC